MRGLRIPLSLLSVIAALSVSPTVAAMAAVPRAAQAATSASETAVALAIEDEAGGALKRFYRTRGFRPLWAQSGTIGPEAETLIGYLRTARLDGLKPDSYDSDDLAEAIDKARGGDPKAVARAELDLSKAFAKYVRDQRRPGDARIAYADKDLKPGKLKPEQVLRAAAFPKSFEDYVADMGWMSDEYVSLRALMARAVAQHLTDEEIDRLRLNMDRARVLPSPWTRHIVVDASSGRLWYYEAGKQVGTMKVVVGAAKTQTPMLVGSIQWAILDPYWNVPDYLARDSIAKKVLGGRSLATMHIEALSDWSASAHPVPASAIDWHAVADGEETIRLRQLPGPYNSMGKVKFVFPNDDGIYLHDTPERELLAKSDRHFSNGCIRLEKASQLGRWLLGRSIVNRSGKPEHAVPLPVPVPVYLTYITATATKTGVAFRPDVYGRDAKAG
ncbi:MAG TPA: L,D-transpeptidase family protein [Sphingomonas sp.]|nr:L,D-transpeptidase family protein [Sphingomonas sp.]